MFFFFYTLSNSPLPMQEHVWLTATTGNLVSVYLVLTLYLLVSHFNFTDIHFPPPSL